MAHSLPDIVRAVLAHARMKELLNYAKNSRATFERALAMVSRGSLIRYQFFVEGDCIFAVYWANDGTPCFEVWHESPLRELDSGVRGFLERWSRELTDQFRDQARFLVRGGDFESFQRLTKCHEVHTINAR